MKVPPPQEPVDWDEVVRLRTEECLSYAEIARRLGRSPAHVRKGLIERATPVPRSSQSRKKGTRRGKRLYWTWVRMMRRARKSGEEGAVPLHVCKAWDRFEVFHDWAVDAGYRKGMTLALRPGRRVFSPSNCFFESPSAHNSRASDRAHQRKRWNGRAADVDWTRAGRLCAKGWTGESIAAAFGVSVNTIARGEAGESRLLAGGGKRVLGVPSPTLAQAERRQAHATARVARPLGRPLGFPERLDEPAGRTRALRMRGPRCSVRAQTIVRRIERGIDPETAITAPPFRCPAQV